MAPSSVLTRPAIELSPDELLIIWGNLAHHPTESNTPIRDKIKDYLESLGE